MPEGKEKNLKEIFKEIEEKKCVVQQGIMLINEFLDGPMCGRCLPCPMGSYEMRVRLTNISSGKGSQEDINALKEIAPLMIDSSMCKKGKDTAGFILETTESFSDEYAAHLNGSCPQRECTALYTYKIITGKCTMCGDCLDACKDFAIAGEKKVPYKSGYLPYEVIDKRCTRCDACMQVCKYDAVEVVDLKSEAVASK